LEVRGQRVQEGAACMVYQISILSVGDQQEFNLLT
jgi:hypothetical protein